MTLEQLHDAVSKWDCDKKLCFEERVAIHMHDGGLSELEAMTRAYWRHK